jgi:hypothetical protein
LKANFETRFSLHRLKRVETRRFQAMGKLNSTCTAPRAVRAAAQVGAAERRGRRPRRTNQLRDANVGAQYERLELLDVGDADVGGAGGDGILPRCSGTS